MPSRTTLLSTALALGLVLVQLATIALSGSGLVVRVVLPATVALVPVALWPHRHRLGIWVMYVGLAANFAVIVANGGLMPIERGTVVSAVGYDRAMSYPSGAWMAGSKDVLVEDGGGHAVALGDGIVIPLPRGGIVASPGDIVVWAGMLLLAGELSWSWQRRRGAARAPVTPPPALADAAEGGAATVP